MGGQVNDIRFVSNARYYLQIVSNGEWKTVAYLNDFEEAKPTIAKVPTVRLFDTWKQAEVQLAQASTGSEQPRPQPRRNERLLRKGVRALGSQCR
jgi:hypothetical protein